MMQIVAQWDQQYLKTQMSFVVDDFFILGIMD